MLDNEKIWVTKEIKKNKYYWLENKYYIVYEKYHYKKNVKRWSFLSVKIHIRWRFPKTSYFKLSSNEFS